MKNEKKANHPSIETNYAAFRHEVETTTTRPLCDIRHHTEKRRIEELAVIQQTEEKEGKNRRWVGIHTNPCVCTSYVEQAK